MKQHCEAEHGDDMNFSLTKTPVSSRSRMTRLNSEEKIKKEILEQEENGRKMIVKLERLDLDWSQ